jgi:hypothetical protein
VGGAGVRREGVNSSQCRQKNILLHLAHREEEAESNRFARVLPIEHARGKKGKWPEALATDPEWKKMLV